VWPGILQASADRLKIELDHLAAGIEQIVFDGELLVRP
jgi:hypothetical protein